ncbi:methionine gamma-lyase [Neobacillus thermocopriae]|uniref:L-methionine gamma-lyase n=1 Tax=Neobacillus thermocopriae TaxID=1215031 RepID=A0A6B3TQH3_9BACI|nr:methionine gamma-lyase [Neobacillus thermocopriae]MED3622757.1 methionine gamma-lyase [Neobacillus thermocopriae]MED3714193.1 methionine gamma-lyase [Neobacillus thermocopriae]NEX78600.1 methionine gamma-lyase [Neobacillus thermocopriae]
MKKKSVRFETEVIHAGYDSSFHQGSLVPPLYQTSTFTFTTAEQGEKRFAGLEDGYIYSRLGNPTVKILEERVAALENGEAALAFSSGMAAVSAVLFTLTKTGDHILCSPGVYGCTFGFLQLLKEKYEISHDFSQMDSVETLEKEILPNTACIYIETPINPTMKLVDLQMVAKVAKEKGIPVVVDNTFCSPYLQNPISFGCDIVIHSATKYIGGHGDVIAGLVVGNKEFINRVARTTQKDIGGIISPFDAWLLLRGLKTLPVRMDRHSENASQLFQFLKKHPKVDSIYYPGDPDHADYQIMKKQMKQPGGLLSFSIKGTKQTAQRFMNQLKLIKVAVSLGDAETLIQHPATMTHAVVPEEERRNMGFDDTLLRLSVGLEAWEDLKDDLEQALEKI